jgi:tRNA (guanine37-N1)-methyltransferase
MKYSVTKSTLMGKFKFKTLLILTMATELISKKKHSLSLKEALIPLLSSKEKEFAPSAFDTFGNIAVIEIPKELTKRKKLIGSTLLKVQPRFETICSIESNHEGKYRIQKVKVIAGKKNLIADYKENGCSFQIPLGKVFFSPRLSGERLRIASLVKPNEVVGAWFSGVGPYPIVIAKNSKASKIIAIELNPVGHKFALKNGELNKVNKDSPKGKERVVFIKGDVKKVYKKYKKFFDRIAMPLPHTGYQFLKEAFACIKPNGVIHFYEIVVKGDMNTPTEQIMSEAKKSKRKVEIIRTARVRQFSPVKEQVVFDIKVF